MIDLGHINVFLTMQCNLACSFCASNSNKARNEHMSKDTIDKIFEEIYRINNDAPNPMVTDLRLTGGEPLMAPQFEYALAKFSRITSVAITTNASFISQNVIHKIVRANAKVIVSIYPDQYETIHEGLQPVVQLLDAGVDVLCTYTLSSKVLDDLEPILIFLKGIGVKRVVLNGLNTGGRAAKKIDALWLTVDKMDVVRKVVQNHMADDFEIIERDSARPLVETDHSNEISNSNPRTPACFCAYSQISILPDGKLVPCNSLIDLVGGSLSENGLLEVYQSEMFEFVRKLRVLKRNDFTPCYSCNISKSCNSGSRVDAFMRTGNWMAIDPFAPCNGIVDQLEFRDNLMRETLERISANHFAKKDNR